MKTNEPNSRAGATSEIRVSAEAPATSGTLPYGLPPKGYRLPPKTRLGQVRLQVADLERSIAYYQETLGVRVSARAARCASLSPHDDDNVLVELRERRGAHAIPRRGRLGLYHYAILLPTRADLGRFVARLAEIGSYAGMSDHMVSEAVYLTDPDGLGIEVYADRPRATWRHKERQLTMATNPLDVDDLIAAGGGEQWGGMPAGTVIGHVHLYVDDINRAAAFYHDALGFDKVVWSYPGALFLSAGGYHHHLGTNTWAAEAPPAADDDARLLEWTLVVPGDDNLGAAVKSLESAGYPVAPQGDGWVVTDPWGTNLRLSP